ncbi:MAG: hypothetical protein Fues2KO_21310 [Fuerstiella sp.]
MTLKLLVVEDDETDIETCNSSRDRFTDEEGCELELVFAKSLPDAQKCVDNSFDGVIIDLKLDGDADAGSHFVEILKDSFRVPAVVLTGTPDNITQTDISVYTKGEIAYSQLFQKFAAIKSTGVTNVFGFRGSIEEHINEVFWHSVFPRIESWVSLHGAGKDTEHSLLRFTLNHLVQKLDEKNEICLPDEVYLTPPVCSLQTGTILRAKAGGFYIVVSPACDLALRPNGEFKSDRVHLCEILEESVVLAPILDGVRQQKKAKRIETLLRNNHANYYHWLPSFGAFPNGVINFRYITSVEKNSIESDYERPTLQVSPHFVKDIVSRFSSYYARQGQPELEFGEIARSIAELG